MGRRGGGGIYAVLLLVPAILAVGFYGGTGFIGMTAMGNFMQANEDFGDANGTYQSKEGDKLNIVAPNGQRVHKGDVKAHVASNEIVSRREIRSSRTIDIKNLLAEGEELPEDDFQDLFVEARLVRFAELECDLLLTELAATCVPDSYSARRVKDKPGIYEVYVSMGFTMAQDVGPAPAADTLVFNSHLVKFDMPYVDRMDRNKVNESNLAVYSRAIEACKEFRAQYGNCAIQNVVAHGRRNYRDKETFQANVQVTFLTPLAVAKELGTAPKSALAPSLEELKRTDELAQKRAAKKSDRLSHAETIKDEVASLRPYTPYELSVAAATGQPLPERKAEVTPTPATPIPGASTQDAAPAQQADAGATEPENVQNVPTSPPVDSQIVAKNPMPNAKQKAQWREAAKEMFRTGQRTN